MKYLLDTCVISELIKPQPNKQVSEWVASSDETRMLITVFTLGEIRKGINKLVKGKRQDQLNDWFQEIIQWSEDRILIFNEECANNWGALLAQSEAKGRLLPIVDSMIAAIAITHQCSIVTRNVDDFSGLGISVINPWEL